MMVLVMVVELEIGVEEVEVLVIQVVMMDGEVRMAVSADCTVLNAVRQDNG